MANLARSFKTTAFLSPRRRPQMPARTLSNSSDISLSSHHSATVDDYFSNHIVTSAPASPIGLSASGELEDKSTRRANSSPSPPRLGSRPITIDLSRTRASRFSTSSSSVHTPIEQPLSARGDVVGGYFPFHEDPKSRMRRPHPFHHKPQLPQPPPPSINLTSPGCTRQDRNSPSMASSPPMASTNTPITSYFPQGFYDNALPVGKYYPSNYEARTHHSARSSLHSGKRTSSSDWQTRNQISPASEIDSDPKIRQYRRDIVAQAAMVLGGPGKAAGAVSPTGLPVHDLRTSLNHPKPRSPRLAPLGSPGPVTPMELESSTSAGKGLGLSRRDYSLTPVSKALSDQ